MDVGEKAKIIYVFVLDFACARVIILVFVGGAKRPKALRTDPGVFPAAEEAVGSNRFRRS